MILWSYNLLKKLIRSRGYEMMFVPVADRYPRDFDTETKKVISRVWHPEPNRRLTMTSPQRLHAFCKAVEHVVSRRIEGSIVECGVWKGGSMMAAAMTLKRLGVEDRDLFLFDTFEGMTEPTAADRESVHGDSAEELLRRSERASSWVWAYCSIDDARRNLETTEYPVKRIHFVKGPVESTIPEQAPEQIAILRLDTDWYESTRHELRHLYSRLVRGGVLIIDDYGDWEGARRAVDEFLESCPDTPFLHRIDETGRLIIKP